MRRILFVHAVQFGYHIDTLYYCKYLKDEYEITYVCWDYGHERVTEDGVRVVYVPRTGGKFRRIGRLIRTTLLEMQSKELDITFIVYFRFCSLLGLFGKCKTIIMDVRTGWILPGWLKKVTYNTAILAESFAFSHVSVITEELRVKLRLPRRKCHILPLGAEIWEMPHKRFDTMNLIYVGTFRNRHIYKTVLGFDQFVQRVGDSSGLTYDIIGGGTEEENAQMIDTINSCRSKHLIRYHGRIPHKKLPPFFAQCNIGVAFVPMIDAQQAQPYTKVFEYLQSGMPVLATANPSNRKIINKDNGVLFPDTPEGFHAGLTEMRGNLGVYDSSRIRAGGEAYSWSSIVNANVKKYFARLLSDEPTQ